MMDFLMIQPGDLVCSRYDLTNSSNEAVCAVYHFVIHEVKEVKNSSKEVIVIELLMKPVGEHGCRVSEKMEKELKENPKCELQVIKMPDSFNQLFHRLQCMELKEVDGLNAKEQWSELATRVALGILSQQNKITYNHSQGVQIMEMDLFALTLWEKSGIELNKIQKEAINSALTDQFQLIQGPPGTGKSVIGMHLAYIFARVNSSRGNNQCVLYCGPSNKTVDVVHDKLLTLNCKLRPEMKLRILHLYGRTHERLDFPDPVYASKLNLEDEGEGKCLKRFKGDALHHIIRKNDENAIIKMEKDIYDLMKQNIVPSTLERMRYKKCVAIAEEEELGKTYNIILCTCNETCNKRLLKLYPSIAQCIVDDCGMANEPETLAAMSLCEHVVLIGDHMQLQPIVKYSAARECGLNRSLFQRYAEQDCELLTRLHIQYHMHPFICDGPSGLFYDGELEADELVKRRMPLRGSLHTFWPRCGHEYPVMFCNIVGREEDTGKKHKDTHSKSNLQEAEKALQIIEVLLKDHKLDCRDIAVLTPYTAQERLIVEVMKERDQRIRAVEGQESLKAKLMQDIRVSSIIKSQGDVYNIVILSTVRSLPLSQIANHMFVQPDQRWMKENLGVLTDSHQVNVGITRAKHGLIIIGNKVLLEYDKVWKNLIQQYEDNGCVI